MSKEYDEDFIEDTEDVLEEDSFSKHALVYMAKPDNRKATQDDVLEKGLEAYFDKNNLEDDDLFDTVFDECRSVCMNCAYYDADLNLDRMKEPWDKFKPNVRGNNFGRCTALPPSVVPVNKDGRETLKTVNSIVYPKNFCSMFTHRANDKRNTREYR